MRVSGDGVATGAVHDAHVARTVDTLWPWWTMRSGWIGSGWSFCSANPADDVHLGNGHSEILKKEGGYAGVF